MEPLVDLLHTWRPANDKPNVLVVAPPAEPLVAPYLQLRQGEPPCEVVSLGDIGVAMRLLRRGRLHVLVMEERPAQAGTLDLLLEALQKTPRPAVLLVSDTASLDAARQPRAIRRVPCRVEVAALRRLVAAASAENPDAGPVALADVLDAIRYFPDECWLRVVQPQGSGDLCIRGGRVVYAEANRKSGEPAAIEMTHWVDCQFELRDLPGNLPQNANLSLGDLLAGTRGGPAVAPPPAPAIDSATAEDSGGGEWLGLEPDEMPEFLDAIEQDLSPEAPGFDWEIEEPTEFSMDFAESEPEPEPESAPPVAAVATPETPPAPAAASPAADLAVFASVAVISEEGRIENCQPREDADSYDPAALRHCFDAGRDYALTYGFGPVTALPLLTSRGGLVIAPVPGSARLIAARLPAGRFGEKEQAAILRLQRTLEQAALSR